MDNEYSTIDEYIKGFSPEVREKLEEMRALIKSLVPNAQEKISYQMPAFTLGGKILVYFAAHKNHIGFYPTASGIEAFKADFKEYKSSKGAVQFPLDEPLPVELISRIVKFRAEENLKKTKK